MNLGCFQFICRRRETMEWSSASEWRRGHNDDTCVQVRNNCFVLLTQLLLFESICTDMLTQIYPKTQHNVQVECTVATAQQHTLNWIWHPGCTSWCPSWVLGVFAVPRDWVVLLASVGSNRAEARGLCCLTFCLHSGNSSH